MTPEATMRAAPLLQRIREVSAAAQKLGTLKSIETTSKLLCAPNSPPFLVRAVQNLARKDAAGGAGRDPTASVSEAGGRAPRCNPFLPYEASMHVKDVGPRHVVLLNKFNVVADHVLIVTASFEAQDAALNAGDFAALCACLAEVDGLAFYNSGGVAGASQRHKHLQLVCGPVGDLPEGWGLAPFDETVARAARRARGGEVFCVEGMGFVHAGVRTDDVAGAGVEEEGREWERRYLRAMEWVAGRVGEGFGYNVLGTRRWMVVVPRREECFEGVSVNALGFAGCLLVRNEEQMERVERVGGMAVLRHTGFAVEEGTRVGDMRG